MNNKNKLYLIFFFALLLRFLIIYINYRNPNFEFQQESYKYYIDSLKDGSLGDPNFSPFEKRLFPGYIFLILPFTNLADNPIAIGVIVNLILFGISFFLVWKIFRDTLTQAVFAFFPPVWVIQTTKASSEPLTVTLLLLSLLCFIRKAYIPAGLILGFAFSVRTISICLLLAFLIFFIFDKKYKNAFEIFIGFSLTASLLFIFNFLTFGPSHILMQFTNLNQNYGVVRIGVIQIIQDILRTIDWEQYRILFSGLFYVTINFITLFILFKFRNKSDLYKVCFYWVLFSLIFVFSLAPFTLIENFSRYTVPIAPAIAVAFTILINHSGEKLFPRLRNYYK